MSKRYDVVIIGAGASGCALAARLSENPEIDVLLLEAGPVPEAGQRQHRDTSLARSLRSAGPGHRLNWNYPSSLMPGRDWGAARGKVLGGSMAINGSYFMRAHPQDFADWAAASGDDPGQSRWSYPQALPLLRALEHDLDYPQSPLHGGAGPMQVARPWTQTPQEGAAGPLDEAFLTAALDLGAPWEADKSSGGAPGVGPIPMNAINGVRRHPGMQYLEPVRARPNLQVRGSTRALRVLFRGSRVVGAEVSTASREGVAGATETIDSGEVVLAAGAIATPQLLLLSGIGPAEDLRRHGVPVQAERPGVGHGVSEHPDLTLPLLVRSDLEPTDAATAFTVAWNFPTEVAPAGARAGSGGQHATEVAQDTRGELELLITSLPASELFGAAGETAARTYSLMLGLQRAESRGRISLRSNNPFAPPSIDYRFLTTPEDLARLRDGMRTAVELLDAEPMRELLVHPVPQRMRELLEDAAAGESWIHANIGLRFHTCGGARMGPESLLGSVTSSSGRVHGVTGLRVADLSMLPSTPSRGPANTAVFIGETIARAMS